MKSISLGTAAGRSSRIAPQIVRRRAVRRSLREVLTSVLAMLRKWRRRSRQRAELARLDERMLRDIGVTPGDVWHEISKPFWRQ
jgi:uncharacterized protein YjiS (DUF1127 family)